MTEHRDQDTYSSWAVGWSAFAGVMLIVVGTFHAFAGLVAIVNDEFYVVGQKWVFQFDVTTWGWIHVLLGIVLVLSGLGIFTGNVAARTVGIVMAGISMLANFTWLPYQPVWASIMIAVSAAVIWALSIHGRDIAS